MPSEQTFHFAKYVVPLLDKLMPEPKFSDSFARRCAAASNAVVGAAPPQPSRSVSRRERERQGSVPTFGGSSSRLMARRASLDGEAVASFAEASLGSTAAAPLIRASDVFFWAVAYGAWDLANVLWAATKNPVRRSLLPTHTAPLATAPWPLPERARDVMGLGVHGKF